MRDQFAPVISKYYALGVSLSNKHPQNINNELRNAVTHMARALRADDIGPARGELAAADRHVERFKRDCLKVCVIYAGKDANGLIRQVEEIYGRINPADHIECAYITRRRYEVLLEEVLGDEGSSAKWEALLERIQSLRESLNQRYALINPKTYRIPWGIAVVLRWFARISAFLVGGMILVVLGAIVLPHPDKFGEKAQAALIEITDKMFGLRASASRSEGVASSASSSGAPSHAVAPPQADLHAKHSRAS